MFKVIIQNLDTNYWVKQENIQSPEVAVRRFLELAKTHEFENELLILKVNNVRRWAYMPDGLYSWKQKQDMFTGDDEKPFWQPLKEFCAEMGYTYNYIRRKINGYKAEGREYPPTMIEYIDFIKIKGYVFVNRNTDKIKQKMR